MLNASSDVRNSPEPLVISASDVNALLKISLASTSVMLDVRVKMRIKLAMILPFLKDSTREPMKPDVF